MKTTNLTRAEALDLERQYEEVCEVSLFHRGDDLVGPVVIIE